MKLKGWIAGSGVALLAMTGTALAALDFSQEARGKSGTHQFYVWCTGEADSTAKQEGANADAAQKAAYEKLKAEGKDNCWPIWQGLETG